MPTLTMALRALTSEWRNGDGPRTAAIPVHRRAAQRRAAQQRKMKQAMATAATFGSGIFHDPKP
jgi:hypothetical protein